MFNSKSRFDTLPQRPPTPPRDIDRVLDQAIDLLSDSFEVERITNNLTSSSPTELHSFASNERTPPSSGALSLEKRRKQVDFSGLDQFHKQIDTPNLKPISRTPKPLRSILKASQQSPAPSNDLEKSASCASEPELNSFSIMLKGVIRDLTAGDKTLYADAYKTLIESLKHSKEIPGGIEDLVEAMQSIQACIERDIQCTDIEDQNLVIRSVGLTLTLFNIPSAVRCMDDDFLENIVDRVIAVLNDERPSKNAVNLHFSLIAQHRYPSRILSASRLDGLLQGATSIHKKVAGNAVQGHRLLMYKSLLHAVPGMMAARFATWFEPVLHNMFSSIKEIRIRAIDVGSAAAMQMCTRNQPHQVISNILKQPLPGAEQASEIDTEDRTVTEPKDEKVYADYIAHRLEKMIHAAEAAEAPQIWSIILLFMKGRPKTLDSWRHLRLWLQLYESFARKTDLVVRRRCATACSRLIYVVGSKGTVSSSMAKLLRTMVCMDIERRRPEDEPHFDLLRNMALNKYCVLLYYTLRPATSTAHIDISWEQFVQEFFQNCAIHFQSDFNIFARILGGLFGCGERKLWNESRVHARDMIMIEDLPQIDPKWIRARSDKVLDTVRICLENSLWTSNAPANAPGDITARDVWVAFLRSVAQAGSHEVTASAELKSTIAHILNLFQDLCFDAPCSLANDDGEDQIWVERFGYLVTTAMEHLGPLTFSEKLLTRKGESKFQVAPTPSNRGRGQVRPRSALDHILAMLLSPSTNEAATEERLALAKGLLSVCVKARATAKAKLELLKDCSVTVLGDGTGSLYAERFWQDLAVLTAQVLDESNKQFQPNSQTPGQSFELVSEIIKLGAPYTGVDSRMRIETLVAAFAANIRKTGGPGALTLAFTEPMIALVLQQLHSGNMLSAVFLESLVLQHYEHPQSQKAVKEVRDVLWQRMPLQKPLQQDTSKRLSGTVHAILTLTYNSTDMIPTDILASMLSNLKRTISVCPVAALNQFVADFQGALGTWLRDDSNVCEDEQVYQEMRGLWAALTQSLSRVGPHDSKALEGFAPLLAAALSGRRQGMLNTTLQYWDQTFGAQTSLTYPPSLLEPLKKMRRLGNISLPDFPELLADEADTEDLEATAFLETQDDSFLQPPKNATPNSKTLPLKKTASRTSTPSTSHRRTKGTPKARLRHDDSQLEFTAVASSPSKPSNVELQHLTERQKDVQEEQRRNAAALFPELRSDPSQSAPLVSLSPRDSSRLNVLSGISQSKVQEGPATPVHTPTKFDHLDDHVGSSPTPAPSRRGRSTSSHGRKSRSSSVRRQSNDATTELTSSPPKPQSRVLPIEFAGNQVLDDALVTDEAYQTAASEPMEFAESLSERVTSSELDVQVDAQLRDEMMADQEQHTADKTAEASQLIPSSDDMDVEWVDASPEVEEEAGDQTRPQHPALCERDQEVDVDVSQVEDSFMIEATKPQRLEGEAGDESDYSFPGSDMMNSQLPMSIIPQAEDVDNISDTVAVLETQEATATSQSRKRRGRPPKRKSQTKLAPVEPTRNDVSEKEPPLKRQKRTASDDATMVAQRDAVAVSHDVSSSQSRALDRVAVTPAGRKRTRSAAVQEENNFSSREASVLSSTEKATSEASSGASTPSRRVLTPRSLIGHIRDCFVSLKNMAFGSQQYSELDQMLVAMRTEAYDARGRGLQEELGNVRRPGDA